MPKMKTRRGAAKRFRVTGSGRLKRAKAFKRHILTNKTRKQKRNLRGMTGVADVDERSLRRLVPYL